MKNIGLIIGTLMTILLAASVSYAQDFTVDKFVVCTDIQNREPVGTSDKFGIGTEKVYAYLEATDITANAQVDVVWLRDGEEVHRTGLKIGAGSRWRTYAYKNLHYMAGSWAAELRDASGNVLASAAFRVE